MKFKFILSDLDGVIRKFPPERDVSIEKKYNLPPGSIFATAFNKTNLDKAVCGLISDESWRQDIQDNLAKISDAKTAKLAMSEWSDFSGIVDFEYLNCLRSKFGDTPVIVLTNGTTRLKEDLAKLGIEKSFFKIINSADVGVCKPDKKIFEHILSETQCAAAEILFIDDSLSHIESAKELGFATYHYKSLNEFKST